MQRAHTSPEEAVLAHIDLQAKFTVPIHYGTFKLGDDSPQSALEDLKVYITAHGLSETDFKTLKPGETLAITNQYNIEETQ